MFRSNVETMYGMIESLVQETYRLIVMTSFTPHPPKLVGLVNAATTPSAIVAFPNEGSQHSEFRVNQPTYKMSGRGGVNSPSEGRTLSRQESPPMVRFEEEDRTMMPTVTTSDSCSYEALTCLFCSLLCVHASYLISEKEAGKREAPAWPTSFLSFCDGCQLKGHKDTFSIGNHASHVRQCLNLLFPKGTKHTCLPKHFHRDRN